MRRFYHVLFSFILAVFILFTFFSFQVLNEETLPSDVHHDLYDEFDVDTDSSSEDDDHSDTEEKLNEYQDLNHLHHGEDQDYEGPPQEEKHVDKQETDPELPIILWWTPFTHQKWSLKTCGKQGQQCYMTEDRTHINNTNTKALIFYGTDLPVGDMPLPRNPNHEWALLHEESPKNVYMFSHSIMMEIFNHTSTFKRESDYPLPMQFLKSVEQLEKKDYLVSTKEKTRRLADLALVNYVHSDCNTPSDRDHFVNMLQRYIKVDSYGECVHNKNLPEDLKDPLRNMLKPKFLHLLGNYKFTLATENAICDDYMTEKLWRPFMVGSIPIILGSPKAREFLPADHSAIFVSDYKNIKDLVNHLKFLNKNDEEYEKYLEFKKTGVQNEYLKKLLKARDWNAESTPVPGKYYHFVEGFECYICRRLHENIQRKKQNIPPLKFQANVNHYGCPKPKKFSDHPEGSLERVDDPFIAEEWMHSVYEAKIMRNFIDQGKQISFDELYKAAEQLRRAENRSGL